MRGNGNDDLLITNFGSLCRMPTSTFPLWNPSISATATSTATFWNTAATCRRGTPHFEGRPAARMIFFVLTKIVWVSQKEMACMKEVLSALSRKRQFLFKISPGFPDGYERFNANAYMYSWQMPIHPSRISAWIYGSCPGFTACNFQELQVSLFHSRFHCFTLDLFRSF